MTLYVRVGNRTFTGEEAAILSKKQIEKIKIDAEAANQKRLENMRNSLGIKNPQKMTIDVTPAGIAARKAAIAAEETKIALENQESTVTEAEAEATENLVIDDQAEPIKESIKKPKGNKKVA
jgi:hypothetical protein